MFQVTSQDRKSDKLHRLSYQDKLLKLQSVGSWQNGRTLTDTRKIHRRLDKDPANWLACCFC